MPDEPAPQDQPASEGAPAEPPASEAPSERPASEGTPPPPPPAERRLRRSRTERMISGVSGGLGAYMGVDPVIVRIVFVLLTIFGGGIGILLYVIAWIVMPLEPPGAAAAGGASPPAPAHRGSSTGVVVIGLLLIVIGAVWLLDALDVPTLPWTAVLALTLILIGLGLLWGSRTGRHGGLILLGAVLALALALVTPIDIDADFDGAFGDRIERPTTLADLESSYDHAFGSLTVDLRDLELDPGTTRVEVDVAFGEAVVWVPADVPVRVESSTSFGSTEVFGVEHSGVGINRVDAEGGYADAPTRLLIDIETVFGSGKVRR